MVESQSESEFGLENEICRVYSRLGICVERSSCDYWHPTAEELREIAKKLEIQVPVSLDEEE